MLGHRVVEHVILHKLQPTRAQPYEPHQEFQQVAEGTTFYIRDT